MAHRAAKLAPIVLAFGLIFAVPARAADGDVACFTVIDDDADQSGVWFRGGVSLHYDSSSHYSKNSDLEVYAQNIVDAVVGSGWATAPGGGGGSGDLEIEAVGARVVVRLVGSSAYTHLQPNDASDGDDSLDFDPSDVDVNFEADTGQCSDGGPEPEPTESATNTAAAIELQTFVHGWAVIVGATALALTFGWKLWKG